MANGIYMNINSAQDLEDMEKNRDQMHLPSNPAQQEMLRSFPQEVCGFLHHYRWKMLNPANPGVR